MADRSLGSSRAEVSPNKPSIYDFHSRAEVNKFFSVVLSQRLGLLSSARRGSRWEEKPESPNLEGADTHTWSWRRVTNTHQSCETHFFIQMLFFSNKKNYQLLARLRRRISAANAACCSTHCLLCVILKAPAAAAASMWSIPDLTVGHSGQRRATPWHSHVKYINPLRYERSCCCCRFRTW